MVREDLLTSWERVYYHRNLWKEIQLPSCLSKQIRRRKPCYYLKDISMMCWDSLKETHWQMWKRGSG